MTTLSHPIPTKDRILSEAVRLFARDGFEAVTVDQIAAAVGIKAPSLYKHYKSKRDIFDAILRRMESQDAEQAAACALPEAPKSASPDAYDGISPASLAAFCRQQFRYWTQDPFASAFRRMLTVEQHRSPEMNRLFQQYLGSGPLGYTADILGSPADALALYGPMFLLYSVHDGAPSSTDAADRLDAHLERFEKCHSRSGRARSPNAPQMEAGKQKTGCILFETAPAACPASSATPPATRYPRSAKYATPDFMSRIMGPNPLKLLEELLAGHRIPSGARVCDLGSGQGLTSVFLAREYGFRVTAADLWSDPEENRRFFAAMGLADDQVTPVKADANALPFEPESFDAVVSTDSYNYFGRDPAYLDAKLLPFLKPGGLVYITVPGMKHDCHDRLPPELLLSWTPEQLDYIHDAAWWASLLGQCTGADLLSVSEMDAAGDVWADWLAQDNDYARNDRKSMQAGAGRHLNFLRLVLRKRANS
jgi:AcrR family transcriptional regulator/cyclopropane fatty-acyl-phospholipid synthase-like methyltransferase